MASLGMLTPINPEMVCKDGKKTGEVMVDKSNESLPPPPTVAHPGHSDGDDGNKSTHGNSQMDMVVFSFRDYILGTERNSETAEKENGIKAIQSSNKSSDIKPIKAKTTDEEKETPSHVQSETVPMTSQQTSDHVALSEQTYNQAEWHLCTTKENDVAKATTDIPVKMEENDQIKSNISICVGEAQADKLPVALAASECSIHLGDNVLLSEQQTGKDRHDEDNRPEPQSDKRTTSECDKQLGQNKEAKKRKQRKKKKMRSTEGEQKAAVQPGNKAVVNTDACTHPPQNAASVSKEHARSVICGEQTDNRAGYKQQLSPQGMLISSSSLQSSHSSQDHLTASAWSPVSGQDLSQRLNQSDNYNHMDAQTIVNHNHCESSHVSGGQMQEAIVTANVMIPTQKNQSALPNCSSCVGESCTESGLGKALIVVHALPLTTPTLPEVIESKGEGESTRCDLQARAATVAFAGSEKGEGDQKLGETEKCLGSAGEDRDRLLDSPHQISLICSQGNSALVFTAEERQTASEDRCSSKMPHNLAEAEIKSPRATSIRGSDTEISPSEEGDTEKELPRSEACINTSPFGLLVGPDCRDQSAAGSETGGGEEVAEKRGISGEQISFGQPDVSASAVSSAETETSPLGDAAESQTKPQSRGELIDAITEAVCFEQNHLELPCREQHDLTVLPHHNKTKSSGNTEGGTKANLTQEFISEEALHLGQQFEKSSIPEKNHNQVFQSSGSPQPLFTSKEKMQQASNSQQVQPVSTTEVKMDESAAKFWVKDQTQSSSGGPDVTGVDVHLCQNKGNHRVHFADDVKQADSSSSHLKNAFVPALDCASLPPITVHETLRHPVSEASFTFLNPPSLNLTHLVLTKEEAATHIADDLTKSQMSMLDNGDKLTSEIKKEIRADHLINDNFKTNTEEFQDAIDANIEVCSEQLFHPAEQNQRDNEGCIETDKLHSESKVAVETELPQGSSLKQDVTVNIEDKEGCQLLPSVVPADGVTCKTASSEPGTSTGVTSHQIKPTDPRFLGETPQSGQVNMMNDGSAGLTKEVSTSERSKSAVSHCVSRPPFVVQPPGPMLSHLDVISDCDISLPECTDNRSADGSCAGVSREVDNNKSSEVVQMLLAQDPKHSHGGTVKEIGPEVKDRNSAAQSGDELENSVFNTENILVSEENLPRAAQSLDVQLKTESSSVISQCQSKIDSTDFKPVCKTSIRDDPENVSCPLISDLHESETHVNNKKDDTEEKDEVDDQLFMLSEEEKRHNEEVVMDNQKEAADGGKKQTGKTVSTLQQRNVPDKESAVEAGYLQPPLGITKNGEKETKRETLDKTSGTSEEMLPARPESGNERQTVYVKFVHQTETPVLECSFDTAPHSSPALGQSHPSQDLNSFAQQREPEQQQQHLGPRHFTEEPSGSEGEEEKAYSLAQPPAPDTKLGAKEGDCSSESLCESEKEVELTDCREIAICQERNTEVQTSDGGESAEGIGIRLETAFSQVGETGEGENVNKDSVLGLDTNAMLDMKLNSSAACKDQDRVAEMSKNSEVSDEFASQQLQPLHSHNPVSSKLSTDSCGVHADIIQSAKQADKNHTKIFGNIPDPSRQPESGGKNFNVALASESVETGVCEIKAREQQSCNKTSATQRNPAEQTAIKGSEVEKITKVVFEGTVISEEKKQSEVKFADDEEETVDQGKIKLNAKDGELESASGQSGTLLSSIQTTGCPSKGAILEENNDKSGKVTADVTKVPSGLLSNYPKDFPSTPVVALKEPEMPQDQDLDGFLVNPPAAAPQCDRESFRKTQTCNSEQAAVKAEAAGESESPAPGQAAQEPDTNRIKALKDAASLSQSEQVNTMDTSR